MTKISKICVKKNLKLFSFFEHEKLILTVLLFRAEITVSTVANLNIQISDGFPAGCALIRLEMSRGPDSEFWRKMMMKMASSATFISPTKFSASAKFTPKLAAKLHLKTII